jgi:PhnB protein
MWPGIDAEKPKKGISSFPHAVIIRLQLSGGKMSNDSTAINKTLIQPMLSVRKGAGAVEFYRSAFEAKEVFRIESPDGAVVSRLSIDGAEFWVSDESPGHHNFSPESLGGSTIRMVLIVSDPDAVFAKAVSAGAKEVVPVREDYGWRLGRVVDPYGHHWEIGHPLE